MLLKNINKNSTADRIYMERYINNWSPSWFTEKYNTSLPTQPQWPWDFFYLAGINFDDNVHIESFWIESWIFKDRDMYIHPDMLFNPSNNDLLSSIKSINTQVLKVAPLSWSRTVKLLDSKYIMKLHYDWLIGRISRKVSKKQAIASVEISKNIVDNIQAKKLPETFFFLPELSSKVVSIPYENEVYELWIIIRSWEAIGKEKPYHMIPAFSLFAKDTKNPNDSSLLQQLIEINNPKNIEDFIVQDLIKPIVESYFSLLLCCGLQLENHAQNILIAIDKNFKILWIVAKDAESIGKDITLMNTLQIKNSFIVDDFMCMRDSDYNYNVMHSFMFDFKMWEYLISPIINHIAQMYPINISQIQDRIRSISRNYINQLPSDFFPKERYSYENIVHDRTKKRNYIAHENPKYR